MSDDHSTPTGDTGPAIPEPAERTIVAWFYPNDDLFAVFFRTDAYCAAETPTSRWFNADAYDGNDPPPFDWPTLLAEMEGLRGPVELVSNGELAGRPV